MSTSTCSKPPPAPTIQEYIIRVPKNTKKKHNVMRFNATLNVDFTKWTQVKMERENNMREYRGADEEMPKFGAGSEFGREAREEARRKKFGIVSRKYKPDDQPWILKAGGKTGKKFKGVREGGVGENAAYYIFTHAQDGAIEAFPLHEWYNFHPIQRFKALSAEEAELEFSRRNSVVNYFNLMTRKRLRNEEDGGEDEDLLDGGKSKKLSKKEKKDLQISEMDEWMDSEDGSSDSDEEEEEKTVEDQSDKKKKKKHVADLKKKKKKKKNASDDENHAFEESDDGDEEGRECDYISDSSESGSDLEKQKEIKSVAEEDALRKLLVSDEEDEEEEDKEKNEEDKNDDDESKEKDEKDKDKFGKDGEKRKDKKKKKKLKKKDSRKTPGKDSSSDFSSDSDSDSDIPKESKDKDVKKLNSSHNSRPSTPTLAALPNADSSKRKHSGTPPEALQTKKPKTENFNPIPSTPFTPSFTESGITEEAVRRYLMRKPMTTTELLQKFRSKKTGLTSEELVNTMTGILKKINPTKQTIKNKMYLSIKAQPK